MEKIGWKYFETQQAFSSDVYEPTTRAHNSITSPSDPLKYLLEQLELSSYFPDKLSLQTAQSKIDEHVKSETNNLGSVPWLILQKLLASDVDFREMVLYDFVQNKLDVLSESSSESSDTIHKTDSENSLNSKESCSSLNRDIENISFPKQTNPQWNSDLGQEESDVNLEFPEIPETKKKSSIEGYCSDATKVQLEKVCINEHLKIGASNLSTTQHSTEKAVPSGDRSGCLPTTSHESTVKHTTLHKAETNSCNSYEAEISSDCFDSFSSHQCDRHLAHDQIRSEENHFGNTHPSDVILAIFLCCDPFMKRLVVNKMYNCQFAIPFMFDKFGNNEVEISLWPIRDIYILGDYKPVVKSDLPIVSFVKIGKTPLSKSRVLNKIFRNEGEMHEIFFDPECKMSANPRTISSGMIEIFWYKQDPKTKSPFNRSFTVLNWRGGIEEETSTHRLDLLLKVSSVLVIFVSKNSWEKSKTLDLLKIKEKKRIVVISDHPDHTKIELINKEKQKYKQVKISDLEKKLSKYIGKNLKPASRPCILENHFACESNQHANVDEHCEECQKGKENAMDIIKKLPKDENDMIHKAKIVPLQGENLWIKWSKIEKELRKKGKNYLEAVKSLNDSMDEVRMEQIKACNEASEVIAMFVNALLKLSNNNATLLFFVFWLKQELDEKHFIQSQKIRDKNMKVRSGTLLDASLGIQHFLREIGQIYEAFIYMKNRMQLKNTTEKILVNLPGVVAKLSICGEPLEIMDGDAGNVPLLWLKEVFTEINNITDKGKITSISVIGVQSSGKSTLLNTMFGSQYPVSAGRCTRGIFAQFIPVCRRTNQFEYVMVLDTEGLRASEKIDASLTSDNEIAAFAVGLSDVSILNIKGESEADMRDILQIVVHALMRLNKTDSGPEYKQTGIFVHQNVSGIDIYDKTAAGNAAFMRHLDKMAEIAAQEEQIPHVNTFTSIVDLDPELDRIYVPNFQKNDASVIASVSKEYCRSIENTKVRIFAKLGEKREVFCNAKERYVNIQTLWKGIQAETFIFSFRNCQEAIASRILEGQYKKITWSFEEKKMEWSKKNDKKLLEEDLDNVENCAEKLKKDFWEMLCREKENANVDMNAFITNHQYVHFMEHRRQRTIDSLTFYCSSLKDMIVRKIDTESMQRLAFLKQYDEIITKQSRIKEEAKKLADNMQDTEITEETLEREFNKWWNKHLDKKCSQYDSVAIMSMDLKIEMQKLLRRLYDIDMAIEEKEASRIFPKMKNSIRRFDIAEDDLCVAWKSDKKSDFKQLAINALNLSFEKIDRHLESLLEKDARFDDFHFNMIVKYVIDDVEKHNKMHYTTFAITESFKSKVICHVTKCTFPGFLSLNIEHEKMYGMRSQLSKCTLNALRIFKSHFHKIVKKRKIKQKQKSLEEIEQEIEKAKSEEMKRKKGEQMQQFKIEEEKQRTKEKQERDHVNIENSTDCIISQLKEYAHDKLAEHLRQNIKEAVIKGYKGEKQLLIKSVLTDLATDDSGIKYPSYMSSPESFILQWITCHSKRMFFEEKFDNKSKYETCKAEVIKPIMSCALGSVSQTTFDLESPNIKDWIAYFREILSGQDIIISSQSLAGAEYEIDDFDWFCNILKKKINDLKTEMINEQDRSIKWKGKTPYEEIIEHLWGCKENCPWCSEPCRSSIPNHADKQNCHECIQHRPVGLSGIYKLDSLKLTIESCEFKVQSNHTLKCGKWCECTLPMCEMFHSYSEYKQFIPNWKIVPCTDMSNSKYWTWVTGKFSHVFEKLHGKEFTRIPDSWRSISEEEAVQSLDAYWFEDCDEDFF